MGIFPSAWPGPASLSAVLILRPGFPTRWPRFKVKSGYLEFPSHQFRGPGERGPALHPRRLTRRGRGHDCVSDWLVWVKLSSLEPGGGASPPGATGLENKGPVDPQNIKRVLIPEREVEDDGLTKQQTSTRPASMRFS